MVATKNFGRDQFFCLNFGRDQKLGEEDEKGSYLKWECMNQKAKPHKQSLVVKDQNDIWVLVLCRLVCEDFDYNDYILIALSYGKIFCLLFSIHGFSGTTQINNSCCTAYSAGKSIFMCKCPEEKKLCVSAHSWY